ncbi:MAG: ABC transporter substrate-binding protein [Flavobacteriaceae bacterium]|nr:ABC transporter substrate-binding protein [Flavobacteriaceae bacterium]
MKKIGFLVLTFGFLLNSCNCDKKNATNATAQGTEEHFSYVFNNGSDSVRVEVKKVPEKLAVYSHFATEMLMALGLGDKIVLGVREGEVLPEFKEQFEKIPHQQVGHHSIFSKEQFLLLGIDFVTGWDQSINQQMTGDANELLSRGIYPFVVKSIRDGENLETVYEDFETLGKIFKVEDKAKEVVDGMKKKLADAKLIQKPDNEKKKILIFSSIENGLYASGGLATDLINRAGGKNIYEDLAADHEFVSFESAVDRNPDIILISYLAGEDSFEEKVKILKTHPALKDLPAVKNDRIYSIALEDIAPGIRNADFIIKLNKLMYGE